MMSMKKITNAAAEQTRPSTTTAMMLTPLAPMSSAGSCGSENGEYTIATNAMLTPITPAEGTSCSLIFATIGAIEYPTAAKTTIST